MPRHGWCWPAGVATGLESCLKYGLQYTFALIVVSTFIQHVREPTTSAAIAARAPAYAFSLARCVLCVGLGGAGGGTLDAGVRRPGR